MQRRTPILLASLAGVVAAALNVGCLSQNQIRGQEAGGLDRKLAMFAFIEDGDLLTVVVGTKAAFYRKDAAYVPFEISIANRGLKRLTLTRESFTLMDGEGNRYPLASPQELFEGYPFLDLDRSDALQELEGLLFDKFAAFSRYPSNFSPRRTQAFGGGSGVVRDRMTLPRYGYMIDYLYFPMPSGGARGRQLELFVDAPELEDPVFVKFQVR